MSETQSHKQRSHGRESRWCDSDIINLLSYHVYLVRQFLFAQLFVWIVGEVVTSLRPRWLLLFVCARVLHEWTELYMCFRERDRETERERLGM